MREVTNFWEVISEYTIEIPIIQRDYAQGRNVTKVNEIRFKILDDILFSLHNNSVLEFDFVYGNIEDREMSSVFIPLDGQQRLSTLFLLHWYLAWLSKDFVSIDQLSKFSYETRTSSREFCQALVKNAEILQILNIDNSLSYAIKNQAWFFLSWIKDPTIKSMLQTLDDIHIRFNDQSRLWTVLKDINTCPVVFRFIKLDDFGLEDDLYIKMNARGKPLTDFENFKAKLEQHLNENYDEETSFFSQKLDGTWTDLFWSAPDNAKFDDKYLNFFKIIAVNNYALHADTLKANQISKIANSIPAILEQIDEASIKDIKVLDILPQYKNINLSYTNVSIYSYFEEITKSQSITYLQRLMFFSIYKFLTHFSDSIDYELLNNWIRLIYNLAKNTEYDEVTEFARSVKSINELTKHANNILDYISDPQNSIQGFNSNQIEEERIKATLILKSTEWKDVILKAESHKYFDGQISFLLLFSNIVEEYKTKRIYSWNAKDNALYLSSFLNYYDKSCAIFSENGLNIKEYLWERALLCKGYYWIGKGDRVSLLLDSHRDYSWKRLLRDTDDNNKRRIYVKEVLDSISVSTAEDDLRQIISDHDIKDIRHYFIDEPGIIGSCLNRFIQKYGDTYLLLKTSITAGYHKELKSYALYLNLINNFNCDRKTTEYLDQCGINNPKMIKKINGHEIMISYSGPQYRILLDEKESFYNHENDIIVFLQEHNIINS